MCRDHCRLRPGATRSGPLLYRDGRKYCAECGWAFKWDGKYCPCCGLEMRTKSWGPRARRRRAAKRAIAEQARVEAAVAREPMEVVAR